MSEIYQPPFTMTEEITNLVIEIGEQAGAVATYDALQPNPTLRGESRIKSIHSSLAIEQNTLTLEQVSDIIDGKRVLGPLQDIREVKNAYEAYERVSSLDPYSVKNLLLAHRIMMEGLVKEAGMFRSKNVGVYAGTQLIHAGTPANYVPELMAQLFTWLKQSKLHPLVKSGIFHYEYTVAYGRKLQGTLAIIGAVPTALGMVIALPLANFLGSKSKAIMFGAVVAVAGGAIGMIDPHSFLVVAISFTIKALGATPAMYLSLALLADIFDHQEAVNGVRTDGLSMTIYGSIIAGMTGLTTGVLNAVLSVVDYDVSTLQTNEALRAAMPWVFIGAETFCYLGIFLIFTKMDVEKL